VEQKAHYLAVDLRTRTTVLWRVPAETTEAFLKATCEPLRTSALFHADPVRHSKIAVARILGGESGRRRGRSPSCRATICSHKSAAQGHDKGKVEGGRLAAQLHGSGSRVSSWES